MDDVTNYINNVGKSKEDMKFTVEVSLAELEEIVAMSAYVMADGHESETLESLYTSAKEMVDKVEKS